MLYFVATDQENATLEDLRQWGLGYAFDANPTARKSQCCGTGGLLISQEVARVDEAAQVWHAIPQREGLPRRWFGWDRATPPTPESLARDRQIDGYWINDALGRRWRLPAVRLPNEDGEPVCRLPCVYDYDEAGNLRAGEPIELHRKLWEGTSWAWDSMLNEEDVPEQQCLTTAGLIVSANYRVDWPELVKLGVFSDASGQTPSSWIAIANGAVQFYRWREAKRSDPTQSPEGTIGETTSATAAV